MPRTSLEQVPVDALSAAALQRATELGCTNAEVRIERIRDQYVSLRDGTLEGAMDNTEMGIGLRVVW